MYARSLVRYFELTAENSIPRFSEFNSAEPSHPRVVVPEITTDQYKKVFLVLKWLRGITPWNDNLALMPLLRHFADEFPQNPGNGAEETSR